MHIWDLYNCITYWVFYIAPNGYEAITTTEICTVPEDVDGRNDCASDEECFDIGSKLCDPDPSCFGIAWFENLLSQPLKLCRSIEMNTQAGWHTVMKEGIYQMFL